MDHEQFLAIRNGSEGVFVFSGCSHKGVIAALDYAKKLFPGERIAGLIAARIVSSYSEDVVVIEVYSNSRSKGRHRKTITGWSPDIANGVRDDYTSGVAFIFLPGLTGHPLIGFLCIAGP